MKIKWIFILAGALAAALLLAIPLTRSLIPVAGRGVVEVISLPRDLCRERAPDSLIPARAGLLIRFRSAGEAWEKLTASRAFREMKASPLWGEMGVEERLEEAGREFEARTGFRLDRSKIMAAAGEDFALAVIPATEIAPISLLAVTRLGVKARLLEIVLRLGDSLKDEPDRVLREEKYRGRVVVIIPPGEDFPFEVAYAVIDGCLAATVSDSARSLIEEVIDLAGGEGEALPGSAEFSAALDGEGFPADTFLECYLTPNRFERGMAGGLPPGPAAETAAWAEVFLRSLGSCRSIGWRSGYREGVHGRLRVVREEEFPPGSFEMIPEPPAPLPAGGMLYGFFTADPPAAGERLAGLIESLGAEGEAGAFPGLGGWEGESGLSLRRDIFPVLGANWSVVFGGLTGGEFIPVPPFALVNRVADRTAAAAVMEKITAWAILSRGLRPVRETHNGVETTTFPGLFFLEDPGYALAGEELVLAGSRPLLHSLLDLRAGQGPAVEGDPGFRRTTGRLPPGADILLYLEGGRFAETLRAAAEWYFAYQRLVPEEPLVPEDVYREGIAPLLGLLRPVRAAAALVREKNVVKTDLFLYIPE